MALLITHKFSFGLNDQPGTAHACYTVDGVENEFHLSNVCNPLGDMLSALASMITNPSQLWNESNTTAFVWFCENESFNWTLTLAQQNILSVRITQTCEFFGDDEVEIVSGECDIFDFLHAIIFELDRFLKQVGLLNYQQRWQTDAFPLTYFLILKKALIENNRWISTAVDDESAMFKETLLLMK